MKHKGRVLLGLILGVAVLAAFTLAYAATKAPDKDVTIESKDVFKTPKKAPVTFSHTKHKEAQCTDCHHEFKDGQNVWKEGQEVKKCSALPSFSRLRTRYWAWRRRITTSARVATRR